MKKLLGTVMLFSAVAVCGAADSSAPASSAMPTATVPASSASTNEIQIDTIAVGTAIDQRELTGTATEFPATVSRLYCWTKISGAKAPTEIKHVWYADGKKEAEVELSIKSESARTWSSKTVWPGKWKVEVLGASGEGELSSTEFVVQ